MKLDNIKHVSTKIGDKGTSKNYSNETYRKSDTLFNVLGTLDELSSFLGLAYHYVKYEDIKNIQINLQNLMTLVATSPNSNNYEKIEKCDQSKIDKMEATMQSLLDKSPLEPKFYLPGSEKSKEGAYLDICRVIARRAERRLDEFVISHKRTDLDKVRKYLNRLSDYLFILSCTL